MNSLTILQYCFVLAGLYNVAAGYIIDEESCMFVFLWSGLLLIASAVLSEIIFDYYPLVHFRDGDAPYLDRMRSEANFSEDDEDEMDHLQVVDSDTMATPSAEPPAADANYNPTMLRYKLADIFTNLNAVWLCAFVFLFEELAGSTSICNRRIDRSNHLGADQAAESPAGTPVRSMEGDGQAHPDQPQ